MIIYLHLLTLSQLAGLLQVSVNQRHVSLLFQCLNVLHCSNSSEAERKAEKAEEGAARRFPRVRVGVLGVVLVDDVGDGSGGHDEVCLLLSVFELWREIQNEHSRSNVRNGIKAKDLLSILSQKNTKEELDFLKKLTSFMEKRNTPIERPPMLGFKQSELLVTLSIEVSSTETK